MSSHWSGLSWQLLQVPAATPLWIIAVVGTGVWKPVPGGILVALPGTRPAGTEPWWQVSQAVLDGAAPAGRIGRKRHVAGRHANHGEADRRDREARRRAAVAQRAVIAGARRE